MAQRYDIVSNDDKATQVRFIAPKDYDPEDVYYINGGMRLLYKIDGTQLTTGWVQGAPLVFNLSNDGISAFIDINEGKGYNPVFGENSWEQINKAIINNEIPDTWKVGDTKTVHIGGSYNEDVEVAIMDFNHDVDKDDNPVGITLGMTGLMANTMQMQPENTSEGSFNATNVYYQLQANILPNLPDDLKQIIVPVKKKTSGNFNNQVIETDLVPLWLFSVVELGLSASNYSPNEGTAYPYFNSTTRAKGYWWLRSPNLASNASFCVVGTYAVLNTTYASYTYGISFGFSIGAQNNNIHTITAPTNYPVAKSASAGECVQIRCLENQYPIIMSGGEQIYPELRVHLDGHNRVYVFNMPDGDVTITNETGTQFTNLLGEWGDFENTGVWSAGTVSTAFAKYGSRSLQLNATASMAELTSNTVSVVPHTLQPSHIYYARWEGYQTTKSGVNAQVYWPIAEPTMGSVALGPAGQWNMYSFRTTRTSFGASTYQFRIDFDNNRQAGTIYADGAMLIDLTADFGAGNEPTQDWCDLHIPFTTGDDYAFESMDKDGGR